MIYCVASTKQSRNKIFTVTSPHNFIAFNLWKNILTLVTIICIMIVLLYRQFAEKKPWIRGMWNPRKVLSLEYIVLYKADIFKYACKNILHVAIYT